LEQMSGIMETLSSFQADLNKIQTVAGALAQTDRQHYNLLTKYEDEMLTGIAVAEQSSSAFAAPVRAVRR